MFSKRELLDAIAECERQPQSYPDCAKLATFYTLYDHLYPGTTTKEVEETVVGSYGESEFLRAVSGCSAEKAWLVIDELVGTIALMQPKLSDSVIEEIKKAK